MDGADAETHNKVRKSPKLFERILRNLEKARAGGDLPAVAHSVLNAHNYWQIGDILEFWSHNGLIDGILFSTLTPVRGAGDDWLRLSREQREFIVRELITQKERYGDFLMNTRPMIDLFSPEVMAQQSPETCGTARLVPSFDAAGERIEQCILGGQADRKGGGFVITAMM